MALYPSVDPCCLRASSYCSQTDPSFAVTHSAIDPSKLISQRVRPARAPSRWPGNDRTEPESVDQLHHGSGRKAVFADRSDRILPVRRTPQSDTGSVRRLMGNAASAGGDRVAERHRAVALARHYRDFEGMSIRQIADRLGRSPATVKAYFGTTPPVRRHGRSRRATSECAVAAAPTPSRATARATPTRIARSANQAQSSDAGRASSSLTRCASGWNATASCPLRTQWSRAHARRRWRNGL